MAATPYRIRLPRGKHIHAAGSEPGFPDGVTACRTTVPDDAEWHHEDTPVTCPKCIRELNR